MAGAGARNMKLTVKIIILKLVFINWIEGCLIMNLKVVGIDPDEVFDYLAAGVEVYAIDPESDKLINLKYESVSYVVDVLDFGYYAYFIVNCEKRG